MTKKEYQKLFQENKLLKKRTNSIEKEKIVKKTAKKWQYKVETDSEEGEEQEEEDETESEPEEIREDTLKKPKTVVARKIKEETRKEKKNKTKKKRSKRFLNNLTKTKKCNRKSAMM